MFASFKKMNKIEIRIESLFVTTTTNK